MKTYYTIYQVTNKTNGKIYIGSHKTTNLNDEYMGSGKYLNRAIQKHGLENFEKEILFVFDNPEEMYAKEAEIVNEDFLAEQNTYNLKRGGFGGFDYINHTGKNLYGMNGRTPNVREDLKRGRETSAHRRKNDPTWRQAVRVKISAASKGRPPTFKGKHHTEEAKQRIGAKSTVHQAGKGNSQYGTKWIYHAETKKNRKIPKDAPTPEGWELGRCPSKKQVLLEKERHCPSKKQVLLEKERQQRKQQSSEKQQQRQLSAQSWYERFMSSDASSIREFVRDSDYPDSHVSFIKMLKKHVPEFNPIQGKSYTVK